MPRYRHRAVDRNLGPSGGRPARGPARRAAPPGVAV